ncbi:MAG: DEAD/DEAH box helicase [Dactylosporangium sp.]|nr:DEAD/DEAH box helicase [Dactylosporangium sp.]
MAYAPSPRSSSMPPAHADDPITFTDLALRPEVLDALAGLGHEEPTPIQREAIPPLIQGSDLLGQAATGTGKTAAFALPILERMPAGRTDRPPLALVLVPTRELAIQVADAIRRYGRTLGTRVVPIYGGQPIGRQLYALERGVDVVVATPGRALDHIRRSTLDLAQLTMVVLDEADEILDMGFAEDIEAILEQTPTERQTLLFSATMPARIDVIARRHLRHPIRIQVGREVPVAGEVPLIRQHAYVVPRAYKAAALGRVLDMETPTSTIVFCRTREEVDQLAEALNIRGYRAEAIHGGMGQEQRDRVMGRLRSSTTNLLVATDVAARGLDVEQLTHVVNYNVPTAPDAYVHRVGRVGRAGREGVAITLVEPSQLRLLTAIERVTRQRIEVSQVPSVADLTAKRLEMTLSALRETLLGDDFEPLRAVVEPLAETFDPVDVALAAAKLAHEARWPAADEEDIPRVALRGGRSGVARRDGTRHDGARHGERHGERHGRSPSRGGRSGPGTHSPANGMTRLFVGAGRGSGIRPQDLVGAITGESRLHGKEIGAIDIADRFSLVEVPHAAANDVIAALRGTMIKGKRAIVRREREPIR